MSGQQSRRPYASGSPRSSGQLNHAQASSHNLARQSGSPGCEPSGEQDVSKMQQRTAAQPWSRTIILQFVEQDRYVEGEIEWTGKAVLDTGATGKDSNFITQSLCNRLQLRLETHDHHTYTGFGGQETKTTKTAKGWWRCREHQTKSIYLQVIDDAEFDVLIGYERLVTVWSLDDLLDSQQHKMYPIARNDRQESREQREQSKAHAQREQARFQDAKSIGQIQKDSRSGTNGGTTISSPILKAGNGGRKATG